ncbi:beta-ketoacyl synthase N-terminal-like domain-containing protein [Croceivirga thetidis]|uniref:Beta-ketoacyl synthase n=1 Tax=Croceivirga thetidis TaxID=2721623 RepID=A0ABX1GRV4_9FLAO|nr:beta-ketoacyl synthase [Croceivirga thetidis]
MKTPISITAISSLSALGADETIIELGYSNSKHSLTLKEIGGQKVWVGHLTKKEKQAITTLRNSDSKYKNLDDSVLFAIYSSRKAIEKAGWKSGDDFGVNIGSSRGATSLFEEYHRSYLKEGKTATLTSPTTTLGNISSWVAHDLQSKGPVISHSITCSTALHSLLNGIAWLRGGMADKFLVGGSEAPLTSFTLAQMKALKIYSSSNEEYPCQALELEKKKNTMVLGEGAAIACLEKGVSDKAIARIVGIGYATEILEHNVSISSDAKCFQDAMKMALGEFSPDEIDAIVMHAPGTIKGDVSEYQAIKKVFCNKTPFLTTNKWKVGHTFGASGMLSIEMAILMLTHQRPIPVPFIAYKSLPDSFDKIMVNAVGFGGNAVSILLSL